MSGCQSQQRGALTGPGRGEAAGGGGAGTGPGAKGELRDPATRNSGCRAGGSDGVDFCSPQHRDPNFPQCLWPGQPRKLQPGPGPWGPCGPRRVTGTSGCCGGSGEATRLGGFSPHCCPPPCPTGSPSPGRVSLGSSTATVWPVLTLLGEKEENPQPWPKAGLFPTARAGLTRADQLPPTTPPLSQDSANPSGTAGT